MLRQAITIEKHFKNQFRPNAFKKISTLGRNLELLIFMSSRQNMTFCLIKAKCKLLVAANL